MNIGFHLQLQRGTSFLPAGRCVTQSTLQPTIHLYPSVGETERPSLHTLSRPPSSEAHRPDGDFLSEPSFPQSPKKEKRFGDMMWMVCVFQGLMGCVMGFN